METLRTYEPNPVLESLRISANIAGISHISDKNLLDMAHKIADREEVEISEIDPLDFQIEQEENYY
jgi:hypothetical protein